MYKLNKIVELKDISKTKNLWKDGAEYVNI